VQGNHLKLRAAIAPDDCLAAASALMALRRVGPGDAQGLGEKLTPAQLTTYEPTARQGIASNGNSSPIGNQVEGQRNARRPSGCFAQDYDAR